MNLANGSQRNINTQSNGVNNLLLWSDARQSETQRKAINDFCVRALDVCAHTSEGSSVDKRSNVLHGSNVVRPAKVKRANECECW